MSKSVDRAVSESTYTSTHLMERNQLSSVLESMAIRSLSADEITALDVMLSLQNTSSEPVLDSFPEEILNPTLTSKSMNKSKKPLLRKSTTDPISVHKSFRKRSVFDGILKKPYSESFKKPKEIFNKTKEMVFINEITFSSDREGIVFEYNLKPKTTSEPKQKSVFQFNSLEEIKIFVTQTEQKSKNSKNKSNEPKTYRIELDFIESIRSKKGRKVVPFIQLSAKDMLLLQRFLSPKLPSLSPEIIKDSEQFIKSFAEKTAKIKSLSKQINETQNKINRIKALLADTPNRHRRMIFETKMKKWCPLCLKEVTNNNFKLDLKALQKGIEYYCGEECRQQTKDFIQLSSNGVFIEEVDPIEDEDNDNSLEVIEE